MLADFHMHTSFSGDSEASAASMIERAISLGMKTMCITDHYDLDYPEEPDLFVFDVPKYFDSLLPLKEQYRKQIDVRIGIELGLQPHLAAVLRPFVEQYPFDFVIGSSHVVHGQDPYYPAYYDGKSEHQAYEQYFQTIPENVESFSEIDCYGHLDYVVRYGPNKNEHYSYEAYCDCLDQALRSCIEHGIGIELNTGGLAYGLGYPNPHPDVIRRYRELGGEIITVGADAHVPERIGYEFGKAAKMLKACGFSYYTVFKNRKPEFLRLV